MAERSPAERDLTRAATCYEGALAVFPDYHLALPALARVRAAQDRPGDAIALYERSLAVAPTPQAAGALGDLEARAGNPTRARASYEFAMYMGRVAVARGQTLGRDLALFLADHDRELDDAVRLARADVRDDVYTDDALAWVLFKRGALRVANRAMSRALRLGTEDASFHRHAELIATTLGRPRTATRASGDGPRARPVAGRERHVSRALSAAIVLAAGAVWAHPLGNFTTNRQARIEIAPDALRVRYVVDLAELPTYLTIAAIDADGDGLADTTELRAWAAGLARDVARNLHVAVDGRDAALRPARAEAFLLAGAGGLPTLRAELDLDAPLAASRGTIVVHDDDFAGLPGWQEIVAAATDDVALGETTAATVDRTDELRSYPSDALAVPPQSREARIAFAPGRAAPAATTPASALRSGAARFGDHLTALVADRTPLSFPMVLSALAIAAMLYARGLFDRLPVDGRVARYAPVANAAIISLAGLAIVVEALVEIGA